MEIHEQNEREKTTEFREHQTSSPGTHGIDRQIDHRGYQRDQEQLSLLWAFSQ
jgi:hypothetical protein